MKDPRRDELKRLKAEVERLKAEVESLTTELGKATQTIRRAKDPNPVERPSAKRVMKLATNACMNVQRITGGWLLKLGDFERRFRTLKEIWELLIADDWQLSEIFSVNRRHFPRLPRRFPVLASA